MQIRESIRAHAHDLGFDAVGFAPARPGPDDAARLAAYVAEGRHGDMGWMAETRERRADPRALWPEARTIVALGASYAPGDDPRAALQARDRGVVSVYARMRDYHDTLKKRTKRLARWMAERHECDVKVFVDTAPVMEKPAAARAGLGWQGKHTNLVSRRFGSWLFLAEVFTTLDLAPDTPSLDHCGSCDRCRAACPTDALAEPYRIDPRRCLAYLTIEHKGPIPEDLRAALGNRVYGCDDCLSACPWNRFAAPAPEESPLRPRADVSGFRLAELAELEDAAFRARFAGTPVKRTGHERMLRNVMIAIGNSGDPALAEAARRRLDDPSPLVREAAEWSVARLRGTGDPDPRRRGDE